MASFSQHAGENWLLKKKMDSEGNIHAPSRRGSTPVLHTLHMTKYFTPTGDEHGRGGGGGDMVIPCPHNPSPDSARCTSSLSNGSLDSTRDLDMFECLSDGGHSNSDSVSLFSKSSPSPILSPFLESTTSSSENENGTFDVPGRYTTAYSGIQGDESDNQCGGSGSSGYHARSNDGADCDDDDYDGGSVYGPDLCSASGPRTPDSLSLPSCRSCSSDYSVDGPVMRGNNSLLMETEQAHNISYLTESAGSPAAASDLGMSCDPGDSPTIEAKRLRLGDELLNPHDRTYSLGKGAGPSPSPRGAGGGFKSRGTPQGPVTLKSRGTPQGPVTLPSDFAFATPENCRPCGSVARRQQPPGSARRSGEYMSAGEKTFVVSPRGDGDGKTADMQTSTPMQSLNNNNTYSLPSFDESPFTKARTAGGSTGEGSGSNASQEQPGSRTTANADGGAKKRAGCGDANANANATFVVKSTEAAPTKVKKFSRPNLTSVKTRFMLSKQSTVQKPAETKQNGETRTLGRAPRKPSPLTLGKPAASLSKSSASPLPTPTGSTNQSIKAEAPPSGKQDSRAQKRFVFPKTRQRLASDDTAAAAKPSPDEKQQSVKTASPNFLSKERGV
ncbi:uncharacterized protein LOC134439942 [Engraulis encrasicolus]|uniref:uncharacterized protein LOC134439942 n=1 Tax=Engraulis encrasicolus TaxID=184585 RepID=UPI002FD303D9